MLSNADGGDEQLKTSVDNDGRSQWAVLTWLVVVPSHALWPPYLSRQRLRRGHVSPLQSSWLHKFGSRRYYPDTNKVDRSKTVLIDSNKQVTREM